MFSQSQTFWNHLRPASENMSAKKYLKTVPPQPPAQPVVKTEKEEQLWNALKRHIMRERERKKQGL